MYLVLTRQGNYTDIDKTDINEYIESRGAEVAGLYGVLTKGRSQAELQQDARRFLKKAGVTNDTAGRR